MSQEINLNEAEESLPEGIIASKQIIEAVDDTIDVHRIFHPRLANALEEAANAKGAPVEWYITFLLPIFASLIGRAAIVTIPSYTQPFVLFSLVLAATGTGKTPVLNECMKPLGRIQQKFDERYEAEKKALKAMPDEERANADQPVQYLFHTEIYTTESLREERNPSGGLLVRSNEAEHHFKMMGAYKKGAGQGADGIFWNLLHDGGALNTTLVRGKKPMANPRISFTGTGHPDATPEAMKASFGDNIETDVRGASARYLLCMKPGKLSGLSLAPLKHNLDALLFELYNTLSEQRVGLEPGETAYDELYYFLFPSETQQRLVTLRAEVNEHIKSANEEAVRAIYPKMEAHAIRIAGVLHVVNELLTAKFSGDVSHNIPLQTFEAAIYLAKYYARQAEAVFRLNRTGNLDPLAARILAFIERKADRGTNAREIQQGLKKRRDEDARPNQEKIKPCIDMLLENGWITEREGRFYDARKSGPVDPVVPRLTEVPTPVIDAVQAFMAGVGNVASFPETTAETVLIPPHEESDGLEVQQSNNNVGLQLGLSVDLLEGMPTPSQQVQPVERQELPELVID
jgi:hypothetical protein